MATFKAVVLKQKKKMDGTYNVKIRITHLRKVAYLQTQINITAKDLSKNLEIKNQAILDITKTIIKEYNNQCNNNRNLDNLSIQEVIKFLGGKKSDVKTYVSISNIITDELCIIDFGNKYVTNLKLKGKKGTSSIYSAAINSLKRFTGEECINVQRVNYNFLTDYSEFLIKEAQEMDENIKVPRSVSLYCGAIRHLLNEMKLRFNDEDNGIIRITVNPFARFKIQKEDTPAQRVLTVEQLRAIFNQPYEYNLLTREEKATPAKLRTQSVKESRYNLALDVFKLSFGLIGMNSADLFACDKLVNNTLIYNRMKVSTRREDKGRIEIVIQNQIQNIIDKYRDVTDNKVFRFYNKYSDKGTFNANINKGLKEVASRINAIYKQQNPKAKINFIPSDLQLYHARLTWATLAANKLRIPVYTIHKALNHVNEKMQITERYIEPDFSEINEANKKVLEYVFSIN